MIAVDASKCSGCRRCEVACSFFHSATVGRSVARIKVVKVEERGLDVPVVCVQCRERHCARCPESAITIGALGEVIVSATLCSGCGACERNCPIGAIQLVSDVPLVCDLCGGEPRCVEACNLGAISYRSNASPGPSLEADKSPRKLDPEEKRRAWALRVGEPVRQLWLARRMR